VPPHQLGESLLRAASKLFQQFDVGHVLIPTGREQRPKADSLLAFSLKPRGNGKASEPGE
jgi:hypothetical protein